MKTWLVALDNSPMAEVVLSAARDLAGRSGARLLLLRAVSIPAELPAEAYIMAPNQVVELLVRVAHRDLAELAKTLPAHLLSGTRVELGTPWRAVCDVAKELQTEVVILGAHGHRVLDRVLGTTTGRVLTHSDASVVVVRGRDAFRDRGDEAR
ncbi:MAG: universal stress protein [Deltaproteobacteria bacterium]|nr:universal stress protein [Deltaproteobacteria bacterium]